MKIDEPMVKNLRKLGRPPSFDRTAALEAAMLTFWRHGYETTSITDLTFAMGISAPSLYNAFGDKRQLFLEAVRRYAGDPGDLAASMAQAPTAQDAIRELLLSVAKSFVSDETPKGCLLASATASGSSDSADVQQAVAGIRREMAAVICRRIEHDIDAGRVSSDVDAEAFSLFVVALIQGLSVLARDGAPQDELVRLVNVVPVLPS